MLAILLLTALLVIRTGPESLLGKALRRPLVDWPAGLTECRSTMPYHSRPRRAAATRHEPAATV